MTPVPRSRGPLGGLRVLELGSFIAGPSASRILGEFGAEVIKIERPGLGDELRRWRARGSSSSLLWQFLARNKKSVTLDLSNAEGREVALDLIEHVDVVIENFRPGTLERWGLAPEVMRQRKNDLVVIRISGYGQTGPYRDRAGFGGVAEALGGVRYLTGHPDLPPTRVGVALADTLAGLYGVMGALMALLARERGSGSLGETVDVALYEAVFSTTETLVTEYQAYGVLRERTGSTMPGIAASNTYVCRDDSWIVIGGNADGVFRRMMRAIGREDMADDPALATNDGRVAHEAKIDDAIGEWTARHEIHEVVAALEAAGVPAGPIYSAADILPDPHFRSRGMLEEFHAEVSPGRSETLAFPGVVPKLENQPGSVEWLGPDLGDHTDEVLSELLNYSMEDLEGLRARQVI